MGKGKGKSTPCWKGYTKQGMKMKGNRKVNNCVKVRKKTYHEQTTKTQKQRRRNCGR